MTDIEILEREKQCVQRRDCDGDCLHCDLLTLEEEILQAYDHAIETICAQQEAGIYRFYYCESEDSYLLGARLGDFYYAHWDGNSFVWDMSRYLPWGEHVVIPETAWKEHTYPSEPKEIGTDEWFRGFLAKQAQQEAEKNDPLTLEELRKMDGEPVWVVCIKPHLYENPPTKWNILEKSLAGSFGVWRGDDCLVESEYGKTWLAYRKKPWKGAKNA